jgi:hypothetical protein
MSATWNKWPAWMGWLVLVAAWGCKREVEKGEIRVGDITIKNYPDCPQDSVIVVVGLQGDAAAQIPPRIITNIPLAETRDNLPEFHDCQRLIEGRTHGALVAIWASDRIDSLVPLLDSIHQATRLPSMGVAVAQIFNFSAEDYRPLLIRPEFSCLYLNGSAGQWEARMVGVGADADRCQSPFNFADDVGRGLMVRPLSLPSGLQPKDIPPVARWDWDSKGRRNYIGIKCGSEWCEIGPRGFQSSTGYTTNPTGTDLKSDLMRSMLASVTPMATIGSPATNERERFVMVKGWYDEQHLALVDQQGNRLATPYIGTAFPHPSLDQIASADVFQDSWQPAAYVIVEQQYQGKLKLDRGLNQVFLCQSMGGQCREPAAPPLPTCAAEAGVTPARTWYAKIVSGTGTKYLCVTRRTHGGMVIPAGTVRWSWTEFDETLWVRCAAGCCTTQ